MTDVLCPTVELPCDCLFEDALIKWLRVKFPLLEITSGLVEKPSQVAAVQDLGETSGGYSSDGHQKLRSYRVVCRHVQKKGAADFVVITRDLLGMEFRTEEGYGKVALVTRNRFGQGPLDTWEAILTIQLLALEN